MTGYALGLIALVLYFSIGYRMARIVDEREMEKGICEECGCDNGVPYPDFPSIVPLRAIRTLCYGVFILFGVPIAAFTWFKVRYGWWEDSE